jgi:TRAP-type C4-dicarboxylate transport system permease small subunit
MKTVNVIRRAADIIIIALFAVLSVLVIVQVFCRLGHIAQNWIDEVSKFVFIWLTYLGGSVTVSRGMNITFDMILDSVKGKKFTVLFTFVNLCCVTFLVAMLVLGSQNAWVNRVQKSSMTHANMGLMNLAIPIGCLLMIGAQVEYYIRTMKNRKDGEDQ